MTLDIPTVMLALVLGFLLLALQMWAARRSVLRQTELQIWSHGCWSLLGGFALLPARLFIPEWISVLGANCLLLLGLTLLDAALYRHLIDRELPRWVGGQCAVSCAVVVLTLGEPTALRATLYSLLFAAALAPGLRLLIRHGWQQGGSIRTVALTLGTGALMSLARSVDAAMRPEAYGELMRGDLFQGLFYLLCFLSLLAAGFGFVLACFERVARRMEELATTDGLTGCANRSTTDALLAHSLERGRREGAPVAFALMDLDHFKQINDRYGHAAGDQALRAFAAAVKLRLRGSDVLGRMGGEEFGLVLPMTDCPGAQRLVEQVREAVAALRLQSDDGQVFTITVSAGVVVAASDSGLSASRVYMLADRELYRAKELGRNRVEIAATPIVIGTPMMAAVAGAGVPGEER
ncbi:MAG: GGDEF domain-containing protein [Paucibacter sp.]|nr:GGDEF domain-containing protein [Roseateles sp.]